MRRRGARTGGTRLAALAVLALCAAPDIGRAPSLSSRAAAQDASARAPVDRVLERWLTRAERDHAAGRTASALATWWRATERAPHDPRAPLRLAALLLPASLAAADDDATRMTAERLRDALETAAAVPALDPATQRTLLLRAAFALAVAGDEAGSVTVLATRCGRLDTDSAAMLRALAGSAVRRGRLAAAEGALDAALRCAGPGDALHAERGAVRLARGRTAEAIDDFREVVRLRPGDPAALRDLAGSLLAAGRSRDALTLYEGLAARAPEDASARLDVARAALQGRALPRAVAAARDAMRLAPRDAEPALVLAAAHLAARDRSAAHAAYEEAQQRNPNDRRAREGLRALAPERDERGAQAPLAAPPSDAGP
jgi:tetratricopeptide (TPR) repeat protein